MQQRLINIVKRVGPHLLFWIAVLLIYYRNSQIQEWTSYYWSTMGWILPVDIAAVYFTAYYLVPR